VPAAQDTHMDASRREGAYSDRMSFVTIAGRSLLIIAMLGAAAPPTPRAIIDVIYSREGVLHLEPADRHEYFSRRIVALWAKDDATTSPGEIGAIDFDLASNSQGMAIASFKVKTERADATHVRLAVTLVSRGKYIRNSPSDLVVHYDFIREDGRWVIDDMSSTTDGKPWTLRGLLGDTTH